MDLGDLHECTYVGTFYGACLGICDFSVAHAVVFASKGTIQVTKLNAEEECRTNKSRVTLYRIFKFRNHKLQF